MNKKIDITNWKDFRISDLFKTEKVGDKLQVPTGANVEKKYLSENGSTPRITVTGFNNGVTGYFDCVINTPNYRVYENFISVSFLGTVFYHTYKASLDMKVHCLKLKDITLDKYIGQFLVAAIKASLKESTYADQISSTVLPTLIIKLPTHKIFSPDFDKLQYVVNEGGVDVDMTKIDTSTWKEFTLKDLGFSFYHGTRLKKADRIEGDIPFVTAGKENKGIIGKLGNEDILIYHNPITIDMFGNCFYHNFDCAGDDNIYFFVNDNLDSKVKIYIASIINSKIHNLYSYTNQFRQDDAENLTILLPVKECVEPDFDYMKQYMKNIENRVSVSLTALQEVQINNSSKINTSTWKNFTYSDLFDLETISKKLDKLSLSVNGTIPVYSSETSNNGIVGYTKEEPTFIVNEENPVYIIFGDHTKAFHIATSSFCVLDNVKVLKPKFGYRKSLSFITTIWQKNIKDLGYSRHWSIARESVFKLPVKADGSPDYDYMDRYMKNVYRGGDICSRYIDTDSLIYGWKDFILSDLFTKRTMKGYPQSRKDGIPNENGYYVYGQNIKRQYEEKILLDETYLHIVDSNYPILAYSSSVGEIGMIDESFYRSGDNGAFQGLFPKNKLSKYVIIYLLSILKIKFDEFRYDTIMKNIMDISIMLPIDINGNPNWYYMEQYIRNIEKQQEEKLKLLQYVNEN